MVLLDIVSVGPCIGKGSFGQAYLVQLSDGQVGVKKAAKESQDEASLLATMAHPNILKVIAYVTGGDPVFMHCEGGNLYDLQRVSPAEWHQWARQISSALGHCHNHGVLHRDVKMDNILLKSQAAILADFGCAKVLGVEGFTAGTTGCISCMAPEVVNREEYSFPADIWSWGVTFLMVMEKVPGGIGRSRKDTVLLEALQHRVQNRATAQAVVNSLDLAEVQDPDFNGQNEEDSPSFAKCLRVVAKVQEWAQEAMCPSPQVQTSEEALKQQVNWLLEENKAIKGSWQKDVFELQQEIHKLRQLLMEQDRSSSSCATTEAGLSPQKSEELTGVAELTPQTEDVATDSRSTTAKVEAQFATDMPLPTEIPWPLSLSTAQAACQMPAQTSVEIADEGRFQTEEEYYEGTPTPMSEPPQFEELPLPSKLLSPDSEVPLFDSSTYQNVAKTALGNVRLDRRLRSLAAFCSRVCSF